jgi:hypothetical protein
MSLTGDIGGIGLGNARHLIGVIITHALDNLDHGVVIHGVRWSTGGLVIAPVYGTLPPGANASAAISKSAAASIFQFPDAALAIAISAAADEALDV